MGSRSATRSAGALGHLAEQLAPDAYITDGRRLFRCLPPVDRPMLLLEDCQTLELIHCTLGELRSAGMRLVRAGNASREESSPEMVALP